MLVLNLAAFENKKYIAYDLVMDFRFEYNQIITWSHKGVRGFINVYSRKATGFHRGRGGKTI